MQSANGEQSTGCRWNLACQVASGVLAFLSIASCGNSGRSATADSIEMDRDVSIEGLIGHATSIAATPGGGFVVVGPAWAIGTNATGEVLWRYADQDSDATKGSNHSELYGVASLNNGNVLLCGTEWTKEGSAALLTILNSAGQLIERQLMHPPGTGTFRIASFSRCIHWNDGIAVNGGAAQDMAGVGWLVKLDGNGVKQWEIVDQRLGGIDAVETTDHNLVMAPDGVMPRSMNLIQVNSQGQIASMKAFAGYPDNMVRSAVPTSTLRVLTNIDSASTEVVRNGRPERSVGSRPTAAAQPPNLASVKRPLILAIVLHAQYTVH